MPIDVDVNFRATISGVVIFDQAGPQTVTATDDISIDLPAGASDQPVAIQPGPASDMVYLVINVAHATVGASYRASLGGAVIPLGGTHVYSGPGMAALLGPSPTTLYFSNSDSNPVSIRILAMRGT